MPFMLHKKVKIDTLNEADKSMIPLYSRHALIDNVPRYDFPEKELQPQTAYNLVHDELMLDGNSRLNLATFVTTWMEPEARLLMVESFDKNMIDKDEYPQTAELEIRCVNMLARLWNSPDHEESIGCSTIGSSEASMLGGMALKWKWRERMRAAGKPTDQPNLVMGANVQVCWEKFCRYWDIEPRFVPLDGTRYHLTAEEAVKYCDENTIGVVVIMGSTMDGSYEPVKEVNAALDALQQEKGWDIPIHVDGASGGFVAPFLQPELEWDFRVPRVQSINTSGHKYGLVYPGVGWIIWRDKEALPEDLIFSVNYLGERWQRSRSTSRARATRLSRSIITSCAWVAKAIRAFNKPVRMSRSISPGRLPSWDRFSCSVTAAICRCLPSRSRKKRISRCSISLNGCETGDGFCQPIPSRRISSTWRCCGWSSKRGSAMTWRTCCWMTCAAT